MIPKFEPGQRVSHIGRKEDGTIIRASDRQVVVEFDNPTSRGGRSFGEFDEVWFDRHPDWLRKLDESEPPAESSRASHYS